MILHKWFHENYIYRGKCHYNVIGDDDTTHKIILNNNENTSSDEKKLLDILLDSKLNFDLFVKKQAKNLGLLQE